jgi:hypothetical protein
MWVIIYKLKGQFNCEQRVIGPFANYLACEDKFGELGAALLYDHKYIVELTHPDLAVPQWQTDVSDVRNRTEACDG